MRQRMLYTLQMPGTCQHALIKAILLVDKLLRGCQSQTLQNEAAALICI